MTGQLMFVQFPHPGPEHPFNGHYMPWNRRGHGRKFLRASGAYVRDTDTFTGTFSFWGEWEPPSFATAFPYGGEEGRPRAVHDPVWVRPNHHKLLQNTDPLVFGDHFLYSNCRQARNEKLRSLAAGSIITFGSSKGHSFVVDTVFVVGGHSRRYQGEAATHVEEAEWIKTVLLSPIEGDPDNAGEMFRLYEGVRHEEDPNGRFSFVPCLPFPGDNPLPFERPQLELSPSWIKGDLSLAAKATEASESDLSYIWDEIMEQTIRRPRLAMGIRLDPPRLFDDRTIVHD